jgi:hypothetical protein
VNLAIRFALALYPRWWRRRYGREMEALLEDSGAGWAALFDLARGALFVRIRDIGGSMRISTLNGWQRLFVVITTFWVAVGVWQVAVILSAMKLTITSVGAVLTAVLATWAAPLVVLYVAGVAIAWVRSGFSSAKPQ